MLDSGVGGLPYLDRSRQLLPNESFLYVADTAGFPYGTREPDELVHHLEHTVGRVAHLAPPKALVLACNTASVVGLAPLRERFSFPVVGVVPAVKPAASLSRNRRIGLLATNRTVLDSYTEDLISQFASDCHIERVGDGDIVSFVETRYLDSASDERIWSVRTAADRFRAAAIDTLVIGCTHFIYVEEELSELLGRRVHIVDSVDGVATQLGRVVDGIGRRTERGSPSLELSVTREQGHVDRMRRFADRFGLRYAGVVG